MELNLIYNNMYKKIENKNNKKKNELNDRYEEYEEEEINSDDYISSSMLDVDTNTYINQTINNSGIKLIKENELEKKNEKEKIIINLYSNKSNNQIIDKDEKNVNVLTLNQNRMIPLKNFFNNNNKKKIILQKNNNNNNQNKDNNEIISFNSNINKNKTYQINDNPIKNRKINLNDLKKSNISEINNYNNIIFKKNNNIINNNKIRDKFKEGELNNFLLNDKKLKNLLILKKGKNFKIIKNSQSNKIEKTKGRLSTSPKLEIFAKNINKSNINLDILRKLKKNFSNDIIDKNSININPNKKNI